MHVEKLYRIRRIARDHGISPQTVDSACTQGRLKTYQTACGLKLVRMSDFAKWTHDHKPQRTQED